MPNWCITRITINHNDEKKLKELESLIKKWTSCNYAENGFGCNWLGNIVGNSGIGTVDTGKETDLKCRGQIIYMEVEDGSLFVDTETAWVPMLKMWVKLLGKYLPDAELIYEAEEPGNQLYSTNDDSLKCSYIVDSRECDGIDSDWEASENYARKVMQSLLSSSENDMDKLIDLLQKSDIKGINVHKWEYDSVEVWD